MNLRACVWNTVTFIGRRTIILYIGVAIILGTLVDYKRLQTISIDYLKDHERYLQRFAAGEAEFDEEKFKTGVLYFTKLIEYLPSKALAYGNLAYCYFYLSEYGKAVKAYRNAIKLESHLYTLHFDLGRICMLTQKNDRAISFFENSLKLMPKTQEYYAMIADEFLREGAKAHSQEFTDLNKQLKEDREEAYLALARLYLRTKNFQRMFQVAMEGYKNFPKNEHLSYFAGLANFKLGRFLQAIVFFNQAIKANPEFLNAYYFRGMSYRQVHNEFRANMDLAVAAQLKERQIEDADAQDEVVRLHIYDDSGRFFKVYGLTKDVLSYGE